MASGGAIIAWIDFRHENSMEVYVQKVDGNGQILWGKGGVRVSFHGTRNDGTNSLALANDGSGGAIITWIDTRDNDFYSDIYAQRIDANGNRIWTEDGVSICTAWGFQWYPAIVEDGNGGAYIVWTDQREGGGQADIYVQHIDATGKVLWDKDGMAVASGYNSQMYGTVIGDGEGGIIIAWLETPYLYTQRIDYNGKFLWNNAAMVSATLKSHAIPILVSDKNGGAIILWNDYDDTTLSDIYVQRVGKDGNVLWGSDGISVYAGEGWQAWPQVVADGAGGAIISWSDSRISEFIDKWEVYTQKISYAGNKLWSEGGEKISSGTYTSFPLTRLVGDGLGGAIIAWVGNSELYAQKVTFAGLSLWEEGTTVSSVPSHKSWFYWSFNGSPMTVDNAGGAILVWNDARDSDMGIYAQRIGEGTTVCGLARLTSEMQFDGAGAQGSLFQKAKGACELIGGGNVSGAKSLINAYISQLESIQGKIVDRIISEKLLTYARSVLSGL